MTFGNEITIRKNRYIEKLQEDISKLNNYISYCNNKISTMFEMAMDNEIVDYYKSQIEKSKKIIEDKNHKIGQVKVK
jgi:DNA replicative helicase MCM subunit Mcm2 (Cdc46/Mcm family)